MKRDMDLVREIMLKVENLPFVDAPQEVEVEGRSPLEISYHIMLLGEAGFIEALELPMQEGPVWKAKRLTYSGHEFLDAARSDTVWAKAKAAVLKSSGALTMEGLKVALPIVVKSLIVGHSG
jgi:hypothetical protein